jgi:hypothetical protein
MTHAETSLAMGVSYRRLRVGLYRAETATRSLTSFARTGDTDMLTVWRRSRRSACALRAGMQLCIQYSRETFGLRIGPARTAQGKLRRRRWWLFDEPGGSDAHQVPGLAHFRSKAGSSS